MEHIKVGIVGSGFIGPTHIEAIRRLGYVEVVALAERDQKRAEATAARLGIPRAYDDYRKMLLDPEITVVHNCTPNHMHYSINRDVIIAGKHIMSEKPLALTSRESADLVRLAKEKSVVNGVNFNYRQYPLVQHLRASIERGNFGRVLSVHGNYLQDWLLYETDFNWRMMSSTGGRSRVVADIGSHWIDTVQHVIGQEVVEVFADLSTFLPVRKRLKGGSQTFAQRALEGEYEEVPIPTEDYASVLLRFSGGVRGAVTVSQMSAGRRNSLSFEIDCANSAAAWNQEEPHQAWIGHRDRPNEVVMADPTLISEKARSFINYPGGHNEGWPDALKNGMHTFYSFIKNGKNPAVDEKQFATFLDGHKSMCIVEAILESSVSGTWTKIEPISIGSRHARQSNYIDNLDSIKA